MNLTHFPLTRDMIERLSLVIRTVISKRERRMLVEAQALTRAGAIAHVLWYLRD